MSAARARRGGDRTWLVERAGEPDTHVDELWLRDCLFVVDEDERGRARGGGPATAHAWVEGYPALVADVVASGRLQRVAYRVEDGFTSDGRRVSRARLVRLEPGGAVAAWGAGSTGR